MSNFCKFSIDPEKPKVIWEITNKCNYACSYCIFSSTGRQPPGELSFDKIILTLHELKDLGFSYIKFTGGEPFSRVDMLAVLRKAKELNFEFDISTNASYITEEIANSLYKINPKFIHVSVDGADRQTHESVRGKKSFLPTIEGLRQLIKAKCPVRVGCVIHEKNQFDLLSIVGYLKAQGVSHIAFSLMEPAGRLKETSDLIATRNRLDLIQEINHISCENSDMQITHNLSSETSDCEDQQYCPAGDKFLFINSVGVVTPCTWISDANTVFSTLSLHDKSIKEILESSVVRELRSVIEQNPNKCFSHTSLVLTNTKFNKIYPFCTENLEQAFQEIKVNQVFCITGSGDQIINFIKNGATKIVCTDINPLAKMWAQLKIEALKKFSYEQFISFFFEDLLSYQLFNLLKNGLAPACSKYWQTQYDIYGFDGNELFNGTLFKNTGILKDRQLEICGYLQTPESYYSAKSKATSSNIDLKFLDIPISQVCDQKFDSEFDFVYLSNVADYWHVGTQNYISNFYDTVVSPFLKLNLKEDAKFVVAYIYDYHNKNKSNERNIFNDKDVRKALFSGFKYAEKTITAVHNKQDEDAICIITI